MKTMLVGTLVVALLLTGGTTVRGEEPTIEALKKENAELRAEVERLRGRLAALSGKATDEALAETAFLVSTKEGVLLVTPDGTRKAVRAPNGRALRGQVSRSGDDIFCRVWRTVHRLNRKGMVLATTKLDETVVGHQYAALPGRRLAVFDNEADRVFFVDAKGHLLREVPMGPEPSPSMQSINGVVVDGRLVVSSDGDKNILAIDLDTYAVEVFRRLPSFPSYLGAIAYVDGTYYLCGGTGIHAFAEEGPLHRVARIPKGNITGLVLIGGAAFVTVNFTGELVRIDLDSGEVTTVAAGLKRPSGLVQVAR